MNRFPKIIPVLLLAAACLGQTASLMNDPDVRRVGMRLACLCSRCKNSVGDCQMLGCSYAGGARERIMKAQAAGVTDDAIVESFVKEQGIQALATPPAEGFNRSVWLMPFVMLAVGLYGIFLYIRRYRRPSAVPSAPVSARYQSLAEKDLADIDS